MDDLGIILGMFVFLAMFAGILKAEYVTRQIAKKHEKDNNKGSNQKGGNE